MRVKYAEFCRTMLVVDCSNTGKRAVQVDTNKKKSFVLRKSLQLIIACDSNAG